MNEKNFVLFCIGILFVVLLTAIILAVDPSWDDSGISFYFNEDKSPIFSYNFTQNVSNDNNDTLQFEITNITVDPDLGLSNISDYFWIIINSSTGNLTFNSIRDNETGNFTVSLRVANAENTEGQTTSFYFIVNATNDAPNFTNISSVYNMTQNQSFFDYLNATDEEEYYPLVFNITFNGSCTHASWTGRNANENCSLFDFGFNLTNVSNISASMNFTPAKNDVGTYWANISVMDFGNSTAYGCPHIYCDNSTYNLNKTYYYSTIVKFNVLATLEINASNCQNKIFQENQSNTCQINITTKGETDSLNISSLAILRNFASGNISNISWFYTNTTNSSANFTLSIDINVTPQKTEIGNWTINFTVLDTTYDENVTEQIYVYVNRTFNDAPDLASISNVNTSMDLETIINLTVYDDDLIIPDKNDSVGGYNETTRFNITIFNQSDLSQILTLSNFSVTVLSMPVSGTNRTTAEIRFTPNVSDIGDYTINITVNDSENSLDSEIFNLTILNNSFPFWNQANYSYTLTVNSSFATTVQFGPINLTGDGYANDTDANDVLTFTNDSNAFPGFNLTSGGMIDFTPWKQDVGYWSFSVTTTDPPGLQNTTTFIFNISNINTGPMIETPISVNTNASVDSNSNINTSEDNYTKITLWIRDEDFKVADSQKIYYNESLNVSLTIEGSNSNLFNFTIDSDFPTEGNNRSRYTATFTPNKSDVGNYNITINVSDIGNSSDFLAFNLTVLEIAHAPVLMSLTNQSSAVNRTLYYDINATDAEDGDDTTGNLTFSYNFTNGTDLINNNETIFNTTSGILNITFNDTQAGSYRINITVNDTNSTQDFGTFWIYVYDTPNITYPNSTGTFTLQENITSNLIFRGNHSVQDNLTYELYINNILRNSSSYYGNNTNFTWAFTPNFTDETYGSFQNLTLIIYPNSSGLVNASEFNFTQTWNVNITHSNAPIEFSGYIGDKGPVSYDNDIEINLTQYFSDIDYSDSAYNQTISFSVDSNSSSSSISSSVSSSLILTLSASIALTEILNITGNDLNSTDNTNLTTAFSNDFVVEFTTPTTTTVPGGGGGGTTEVPVSLKIIMPDPVSAFKQDRIVVPIVLFNDGQIRLSGITLSGVVVKDNAVRNDITLSFDKFYFSSLDAGKKENLTLTIDVATDELGTFEITINADVQNPKYKDWGKLYLTVKEGEKIEERILFTEEFIADNPECLELKELVEEAKRYAAEGRVDLAIEKSEEALSACKESISQPGRARIREVVENKLYRYLLIATLFAFFTGISYYSYRRIKLKRSRLGGGISKQEKIIKIKESIK